MGDDVGVDVVEAKLGEPSVQEPNGNRQETSDTQSGGDHLIGLACRKHLLSESTVGDGVTVVRLGVLSTPQLEIAKNGVSSQSSHEC